MAMEQRSVSAERGALVSLWGLLGLSIVKGTVGWLTGSKALLADACQSAADCAGSVTSYLGIRKARVDPNSTGSPRQKPESAVVIVLSAMLLVGGIEIGISSVRSVANGVDEAPGVGAVIVIAAGIGVREGLVRYKRSRDSKCGIRGDRTVDNRSDIFASLTALVGTSGAVVGDLYDMPYLYVLDPAAGLVISVFVVRMGYRMTADVLRTSDRGALDETDAQTLLEAVQRVEGVVAVDEVKAREHGHYIILDVVIRVNPRISVFEGQDIAHRVRRQLTKRFLHIMDANVQVQPYDPGFPYKSNHHEEELSSLLQ
ncbi:cation diffusion facilitator family transporter [Cohnella silvisoli]|uniref:Cation diffusion facilitator family transporter n=1 Tax=Cohnella silvisoli TaxID=2873699 RepID=A0ABV1KP02_9BACL|nr:cation diffusion facilitator family transporter [Cohnella silvisoli]MCD9025672.1 cation diffusion facilitator family transporter [Cohnella silvisoli]